MSDLETTIETLRGQLDGATAKLNSGQWSPARWQRETLKIIAASTRSAYVSGTRERLGAGGALVSEARLSRAERADITRLLNEQVQYLNRFTDQIERGELSEGQIRARARLYAQSLRTAYNEALTYGVYLPFQPGRGTSCGHWCRCSWRKRLDGWYWTLDPTAEHCTDCMRRADGNPYSGVKQ